MATTRKIFALVLALVVLVLAAPTAHAEEAEDSKESEAVYVEASCSGWDCFEDSGSSKAGQWTEAEFFEVGLRFDRQYGLFSLPNDLDKVRGGSNQLALAYGWGTHRGDGISAITFRLGSYGARGERDGQKVDNGQGTFGVPETFTPGFMIGQFLSRRLLLTEGFSLPLSENGPGFQFDLGASVTIVRFLGVSFAAEIGINAGIYRTGLKTADGDQVNMLGLGPSFGFIFEPWGDYRVTK